MKFYTSVILRGNNILLRGYENKKKIQQKIRCKPYLFVSSKNESASYKTIFGESAERIDFDELKGALKKDSNNEPIRGDLKALEFKMQ